jgi:hypothetical protein
LWDELSDVSDNEEESIFDYFGEKKTGFALK